MLRAIGLTYSFPGSAKPAVAELALDLSPGEWLAVAGPSGCGKSTLLRLLAGLRQPQSGLVTLDGAQMPPRSRRAERRGWHRRMLLLPQDTARAFNPALPLRGQFRAAMALHGIGAGAEERDALALDALVRCGVTTPHPLDRHADALSGGQRQRAALARLLCLAPRVLLLDEPTAALDPVTALEVCRLLDGLRKASGGPALITATHLGGTMAQADRVMRMQAGRLATPGPHN